jgi:hypothetical protein
MGAWEVLPEDSGIAAVHAALLPNGEVVYYSGNTGPEIPAQVRIWNPADGSVRTPPNEPETDLFCSGHALLPDGRLFVCGGTGHYSTGPDDPWGAARRPTSSTPPPAGSASRTWPSGAGTRP